MLLLHSARNITHFILTGQIVYRWTCPNCHHSRDIRPKVTERKRTVGLHPFNLAYFPCSHNITLLLSDTWLMMDNGAVMLCPSICCGHIIHISYHIIPSCRGIPACKTFMAISQQGSEWLACLCLRCACPTADGKCISNTSMKQNMCPM